MRHVGGDHQSVQGRETNSLVVHNARLLEELSHIVQRDRGVRADSNVVKVDVLQSRIVLE